jgi:deoxyhypusine synthase
MGRWLADGNAKKKASLIQTAYEHDVPIYCPAFSDSSAGFGLVMHQHERPEAHVSIDSVRDFRELTEMKIAAENTGMLIVGGGVPKNFLQDTVICAELLGREVPMHKYAIQITVADARDGACSSSTLKEACSWGKVDISFEQMVYAEATSVIPLLGSYAYHQGAWRGRKARHFGRLYD